MGKTTIQVSDQTKAQLDDIKKGDMESYDATLQRVIRGYDTDQTDGLDTDAVREIIRDEVVREALE